MPLLCRPFFSSFALLICFVFFSSCRFFPPQGDNSNTITKCANTENRGHSYLWTVRHPLANGTVHFFGYLRVPANLIWPSVFQEVKRQFLESDVAVFESDDKGIEQLAECIRRQKKGEKENLNASLGERLDEFLRRTKLLPPIPAMQWAEISTEWLVPSLLHLLSNRELSQSPVANGSQIDTILKQEAKLRGKRLEFIEHLPELCDYLPSFGHQQLEFAIEHIIDELEATEKAEVDLQQSSTRTGIRLYNCGMFEAVDDLIGQSFLSQKAKGQTEKLGELNKRLISDVFTRRNERWIQKIIQLIEQNSQKRIFFAFGTGHLIGNGSIAQLLRLHGYSVDEQQFEQKVEKEMNENATAKSSANQQKSDPNLGNSLFWTLFAVAFAILCALALFGIVRFLVVYEQNRGKAVNEQSIIMASLCQNGRFLTNDTEGQKANNENASLCKNGHIVTNDKEGQKADNEIVKS